MKFNELFQKVINEAKTPNKVNAYYKASQMEGPSHASAEDIGVKSSGINTSPIGRPDFNPEKREVKGNEPKDEGMKSFVDNVRIMTKAVSLLKNSDFFNLRVRQPVKSYKESRKQISSEDEKILKSHPGQIQKMNGQIENITTVELPETYDKITKAKASETSKKDVSAFVEKMEEKVNELNSKLEILRGSVAEYTDELNGVYARIDDINEKHEEMSEEYSEDIIDTVQKAAKELIRKMPDELAKDPSKQTFNKNVSLEELNYAMLNPDELESNIKNAETQINLLEMLASNDPEVNPIYHFFEGAERKYEEMKDYSYQLKHGDNYSISTERLYSSTPFYQFVRYIYSAILKEPKIALNKNQQKKVGSKITEDPLLTKLKDAKTQEEFEAIKPEVLNFIDKSNAGLTQKKELKKMANGPFNRRGTKVSTILYSTFKSMMNTMTESFDDYAAHILQEYSLDDDDFKLDLMEILENRSKQCTGPTKKASSDRKGKKWTKCAKQSDGSYKRIHWGDPNAKVTGKSGNTKRKKNFRKRHNCKNAKQGSANQAACNDW